MASIRGILNIQSLNELTSENMFSERSSAVWSVRTGAREAEGYTVEVKSSRVCALSLDPARSPLPGNRPNQTELSVLRVCSGFMM